MNAITWNIRGIRTSLQRLLTLLHQSNVALLILIEPKQRSSKLTFYRIKLGFSNALETCQGNIWIFWNASLLRFIDVQHGVQASHLSFIHIPLQQSFAWSAVYGKHTIVARQALWESLTRFSQQNAIPWIISGDFNTYLSLDEHDGRTTPPLRHLQDFSQCVDVCGLQDMPFVGSPFTWSRGTGQGRVRRRLDRHLCTVAFTELFVNISVQHLSRTTSDHSPMLLKCSTTVERVHVPFRYINAWANHSDFKSYVQQQWAQYPMIGGMRGLYMKLNRLKKDLQIWNKNVYGNIFNNVVEAEAVYRRLEVQFDMDPSPDNRTSLSLAQAKLLQATQAQTSYWAQKSRIRWISEGEANTAYFHAVVKDKHRRQHIANLRNSAGDLLLDNVALGAEAVSYYQKLFEHEEVAGIVDFITCIPSLVTSEDNCMLLQLPTAAEIKEAVWNLSPASAAGPDGYNGQFFRTCWDILQLDVTLAVQEFFLGVPPPTSMLSSIITLIPKKAHPLTYADFRPICLSKFISKVTTRILATRLNVLLPRIISSEQIGFLKGHDISEHVNMANEMVHILDRKVRHGQAMVKLDMAKAFDRVNWSYLEAIMLKFGFEPRLLRILINNMRLSKLSISVNGTTDGFFSPSRGVKQGDPLSPLLFIICSEGFTRGLNSLLNSHQLRGFASGRVVPVSHLAYADDLLIFLNASTRNLARFQTFLQEYQRASGQLVSYTKSQFVLSSYITNRQQHNIIQVLAMQPSSLPIKYLGSYLYRGVNRASYCASLLQHFDSKLTGWASRLLSPGSRLILLKSVLTSIPLHILAASRLPKSIIQVLNRKISFFLWGGQHQWATLGKLCYPETKAVGASEA